MPALYRVLACIVCVGWVWAFLYVLRRIGSKRP
jgi:hypothetical protein